MRGEARCRQDEYVGALADFNECLRLRDDFAPAYICRCRLLRLCGDLEAASQDCARALSIGPRSAAPLNLQGELRRDSGDTEGALRDFEEAISSSAHFADAYFNLAATKEDLVQNVGFHKVRVVHTGLLAEALSDYEQGLLLNPGSARAPQACGRRDALARIVKYPASSAAACGQQVPMKVSSSITPSVCFEVAVEVPIEKFTRCLNASPGACTPGKLPFTRPQEGEPPPQIHLSSDIFISVEEPYYQAQSAVLDNEGRPLLPKAAAGAAPGHVASNDANAPKFTTESIDFLDRLLMTIPSHRLRAENYADSFTPAPSRRLLHSNSFTPTPSRRLLPSAGSKANDAARPAGVSSTRLSL